MVCFRKMHKYENGYPIIDGLYMPGMVYISKQIGDQHEGQMRFISPSSKQIPSLKMPYPQLLNICRRPKFQKFKSSKNECVKNNPIKFNAECKHSKIERKIDNENRNEKSACNKILYSKIKLVQKLRIKGLYGDEIQSR